MNQEGEPLANLLHPAERRLRFAPLLSYGIIVGLSLCVSFAALKSSHSPTLTNPVVIAFAILLVLPAIITAIAPAAGLMVVLTASLISWAVPALIPQLSALGPETTFGIAVLTAWIGLLVGGYVRGERLIATPLLVPLLVWNAWVLLSFLVNIQRAAQNQSTFFTVFLLINTAFFVYVANAVKNEQSARRVLLMLVFSSVPLSLVAYLQYGQRYLGFNYSAIHPALETLAEHVTYTVRVAGTLSDATLFSFYYLVVFLLAAVFVAVERQRKLRVALFITIAFDIWPFMVTFTKSTLAVTTLALLVFAWVRRDWHMALGSVLISAAAWVALAVIPFSSFMGHQALHAIEGEDVNLRIVHMQQCLAAAPSHALFGLGPLGAVEITGSHCHSLPLDLLVDFGVIGTVLYGWFVWRVVKLSWRVLRSQQSALLKALAQANLALLLAFGVLALFWPLVNFPMPWFWVIVALVAGGGLYQLDARAQPGASSSDDTNGSQGRRGAGISLLDRAAGLLAGQHSKR